MPLNQDLKLVLEVQQEAHRDLIEVVRSTLNERIMQVEKQNAELIASLQFTQKEMDDVKETNAKQEEEIIKMKKEKAELKNNNREDEMDELKRRMNYHEDYSRRKNLRIDGVDEQPGENWEVTQEKVQRLARDKFGKVGVQLERAHRVGSGLPGRDGGPPRPRTIVARFFRYSDREHMLRNSPKLKDSNVYLNEDLCEASVQERKAQMPELRKARAAGKIAYFRHTRLVIRERNDRARQDNSDPNHTATTASDLTHLSADPTPASSSSAADAGAVGSGQGARPKRIQSKRK